MKRKDLEKAYSQLYTFDDMGERMKCVYCGDVRECLDHCPPLSLVHAITPQIMRARKIQLRLYPSCSACNQALGAKGYGTYEERLVFLYTYYQNKTDRVALWDNDEIEELGVHLAQMVRARQLHVRRELFTKVRGIEQRLAAIKD